MKNEKAIKGIHRIYKFVASILAAIMLVLPMLEVQAASSINTSEAIKEANETGEVALNDKNIYWSPYSWFAGDGFMQTVQSGGYLKLAFTGTHLGIDMDLSSVRSGLRNSISVRAYIDGSSSSITKRLSEATGNEIVFSDTLTDGNHYAIVYVADSTSSMHERWNDPLQCAIKITGIKLSSGGETLDLGNTPLNVKTKKALLYGDSITEGYGTGGAEYGYAAVLAQKLGMEYGQIGYSGVGWSRTSEGFHPFYITGEETGKSLWRNYAPDQPRMKNNSDLSEGFIDGTPDAIFLNMGTNDVLTSVSAQEVCEKLKMWLADVRESTSGETQIYVIVPFIFGAPGRDEYHESFVKAVNDYKEQTGDSFVSTVDLGAEGYNAVIGNKPNDGLHPNKVGSEKLAGMIEAFGGFPKTVNILEETVDLFLDETLQLTLNTDIPVIWTSSNQDIATVKDGCVIPKRAGDVLVRATSEENSEEYDLCMVHIVKEGKIPTGQLTAVADCEDSRYPASNAVDGNKGTIWHSFYEGEGIKPDIPGNKNNSITIDLGNVYSVGRLDYTPRTDAGTYGDILKYELWYSLTEDGDDFVKICEGDWEAAKGTKVSKFNPVRCRRIRLRAMGTNAPEQNLINKLIAAAEIDVYRTINETKISEIITPIPQISIKKGTEWDDLLPLLPSQIEVSLSDGTTTELLVEWKEETYTGENCTVLGDLVCSDNITNPDGLQVKADVVVAEELPYLDVNPGDWYYDAVKYNFNKDIMIGLDNFMFGPAETLGRAQFAVILYRMNGSETIEFEDRFADVPADTWFTDAVLWAAENGIINGYSDSGLFGPADAVTREQAVTMMYRYAKAAGWDVNAKADLSEYPDRIDIAEFAREAMEWAVAAEIIRGSDGKLNPQNSMNRAEAATVMMRFMELYK